jgi:hypothetical protein
MKANVHVLSLLAFGNACVLIFVNSFCAIAGKGMGDRKEANQIVAVHNGQVFRFNEVVHIFEGTAPGIPGKKSEFMKAWFKGVDRTKAEERFICRPVVGHSGGPFPRFSKGAVFKVKVETLTLSLTLTQSPTWALGLGELACSLTLFRISRYLVLACWRNTGDEIVGIV